MNKQQACEYIRDELGGWDDKAVCAIYSTYENMVTLCSKCYDLQGDFLQGVKLVNDTRFVAHVGSWKKLTKQEYLEFIKPKYKYGIEYETNGQEPDLPDDVLVEVKFDGGFVSPSFSVAVWDWVNSKSFKIVDERYKPAEPEKHYWDGKEDLQVGMVCLSPIFKGEFELVKTRTNDSGTKVALLMPLETFRCQWVAYEDIKPIDTRTEKQKAIDEVFSLSGFNASPSNVLSVAYDKWVGKDE